MFKYYYETDSTFTYLLKCRECGYVLDYGMEICK